MAPVSGTYVCLMYRMLDDAISRDYPFDHAGKGETSLLMALCPEAVDKERLKAETASWYLASAQEASPELGNKGRDLVLDHMRRVLARD